MHTLAVIIPVLAPFVPSILHVPVTQSVIGNGAPTAVAITLTIASVITVTATVVLAGRVIAAGTGRWGSGAATWRAVATCRTIGALATGTRVEAPVR